MHPIIAISALLTLTTAISVPQSSIYTPGQPCDWITPCPSPDQTCTGNCKDLRRCRATCEFRNKYQRCPLTKSHERRCKSGTTCKVDPRRLHICSFECRREGACIPDDVPSCGGAEKTECPEGLFCYDKPWDGCDARLKGVDCEGICL